MKDYIEPEEVKGYFNLQFSSLVDDLNRQYVAPLSGDSQRRWENVLEVYARSDTVGHLGERFFQKYSITQGLDFTPSFVNFTLHLARYEQQATKEPGIVKIVYPNDLYENICGKCTNDGLFADILVDYFADSRHQQSDPDIVRVFEYVALDTAMIRLGIINDQPERSQPYDQNNRVKVDAYYQLARGNIGKIADYLQNRLTWADIFQYQQIGGWKIFKYFLEQEDTYKMTYPDRYTLFLDYILTRLGQEGQIPVGKQRMWLVGAGDAPELPPLERIIGRTGIDQIYTTDIYAPPIPFPMVKAIHDGKEQCDPGSMIMDPRFLLKQLGFVEYLEGVDICDAARIPGEIEDITISTILGVLVHIDGPNDKSKMLYKQAIQNWIARGREKALFISLWLSKAYLPISAMVLQKIQPELVDILLIRSHKTIGVIFNTRKQDGSFVWSDEDIRSLGIAIVYPDEKDFAELKPGSSYIGQFIQDPYRRAVSYI